MKGFGHIGLRWLAVLLAAVAVLAAGGCSGSREQDSQRCNSPDSIKAGDTLKSEIDSKNRALASKMMHITRRGEIVEDFMRYLSEETGLTAGPYITRTPGAHARLHL